MAFHVACPITSRNICFCSLGFPRPLQDTKCRDEFMKDVAALEEFMKDPWGENASKHGTVQVLVPKVVQVPAAPPANTGVITGGGEDEAGVEAAAAVSAQNKRSALQRKAAAAMIASEDYARRFESGDISVASKDLAGDEHGNSNANALCRMCFLGENEGSERARRMLSCNDCGKKYHKSCLKSWAQHRDLFHWSSWTCPSCRTCEVCRRTGDPNKFMFCKRCDGAYHCYCQHPPHKNVSSGPYLCPKHTRCHSCDSTVPGNGLSVRWFLGYTCCDACGRLFVKGNYCPVCLKVYRDSESTPMVCCDICQRWVHCQCDGISDEKYQQFQVDGNLQYKCATCRGECYQVKDLEDAVQELWRKKDLADQELTATLRAAAGLPTQEDIFSISPYSDDEEDGPVLGRCLKLSLKGSVDKSPKKSKDYGKSASNKMHAKKKWYQASLGSKPESSKDPDEHQDVPSHGFIVGNGHNDLLSLRNKGTDVSSPEAGIVKRNDGVSPVNQSAILKRKFVKEVIACDEERPSRIVKINCNRSLDSANEDTGKHPSKPEPVKAKKLVINLGPRKINVAESDASNYQKEQDLVSHNGDKVDQPGHVRSLKISGKFGKVKSEETVPPQQTYISLRKRNNERDRASLGPADDRTTSKGDKGIVEKRSDGRSGSYIEGNDDSDREPAGHSLPKDSKPLLKFKLKKPNPEFQNFQVSHSEEERGSLVKGQRSKRKRPSPLLEKSSINDDRDVSLSHDDVLVDEMMDASWILKKLGVDAIGKRVEVHQTSDNSWQKGVVTGITQGTSTISVTLEDSKVKSLELGKEGVRFIPQKQKRPRT